MGAESGSDEKSISLAGSARVPNTLILALCAALGFTGFSIGTSTTKGIDAKTVSTCFDNAERATGAANTAIQLSQTALDVAGQHGGELSRMDTRISAVSAQIQDIRVDLLARTASRYTSIDANRDKEKAAEERALIKERIAQYKRGLEYLEEDIDRLDKLIRKD